MSNVMSTGGSAFDVLCSISTGRRAERELAFDSRERERIAQGENELSEESVYLP